MNFRDVEYFAAIAEHGNVGRAAEALGLSQPALSMCLRRLEASMRAKLVRRTPKGVELTAPGEAVYAYARRLRVSANDISREVADLSEGHTGHLQIGTNPGYTLHLVPAACEVLMKTAPHITLRIMVAESNALLATLRNGQVDLAITNTQLPQDESLVREHLYDEQFVVYAATGHRLMKRRNLTLADLAHERWALAATNGPSHRQLNQVFSNAGLPPPRIGLETAYLSLRNHLIAASNFLALNSRPVVQAAAAQYPIAELAIKNFLFSRPAGVVYRKDAYLSPAAKRFIEILKTTAKDLPR